MAVTLPSKAQKHSKNIHEYVAMPITAALEHTTEFELDLSTGVADPHLLPTLASLLHMPAGGHEDSDPSVIGAVTICTSKS